MDNMIRIVIFQQRNYPDGNMAFFWNVHLSRITQSLCYNLLPTSVVGGGDCVETFLTRSVPNLQLDFASLQLDRFDFEIDAWNEIFKRLAKKQYDAVKQFLVWKFDFRRI